MPLRWEIMPNKDICISGLSGGTAQSFSTCKWADSNRSGLKKGIKVLYGVLCSRVCMAAEGEPIEKEKYILYIDMSYGAYPLFQAVTAECTVGEQHMPGDGDGRGEGVLASRGYGYITIKK